MPSGSGTLWKDVYLLSATFYHHNDRNRCRRDYANPGQNPLEHRELSLVFLDFVLDRFKPIVLIC